MRRTYSVCGLLAVVCLTDCLLCARDVAGQDDPAASRTKRPNVVFILTDDQRWNCLGLADDSAMSTPNVRGVRTDRWKYIRYPHGDGGPDRHPAELHEIRSDPHETRNLINQPRYAPVVERLSQELDRLIRQADGDPDTMPIDEGVKSELPDPKIR